MQMVDSVILQRCIPVCKLKKRSLIRLQRQCCVPRCNIRCCPSQLQPGQQHQVLAKSVGRKVERRKPSGVGLRLESRCRWLCTPMAMPENTCRSLIFAVCHPLRPGALLVANPATALRLAPAILCQPFRPKPRIDNRKQMDSVFILSSCLSITFALRLPIRTVGRRAPVPEVSPNSELSRVTASVRPATIVPIPASRGSETTSRQFPRLKSASSGMFHPPGRAFCRRQTQDGF